MQVSSMFDRVHQFAPSAAELRLAIVAVLRSAVGHGQSAFLWKRESWLAAAVPRPPRRSTGQRANIRGVERLCAK